MRQIILALLLCGVFFFLPFQIYLIGEDNGIGIQGAVYRFQISGYGNLLIPITRDVMYVVNGVYSGKTALSIIMWSLGTLLLAATTVFGLIHADNNRTDFYRRIGLGLLAVCICYLVSCIVHYGWFFSGPAGVSIPFGIFIMFFWIIIIYKYPFLFKKPDQ